MSLKVFSSTPKTKLVSQALAIWLTTLLAAASLSQPLARANEPTLAGPPIVQKDLANVLRCPASLPADLKKKPVLLMRGMIVTSAEHFSWNLQNQLTKDGYWVCTLDPPGRTLGDMQDESEYFVQAVREIYQRGYGKVDIVTQSVGGLVSRWGIKHWPDLQKKVNSMQQLGVQNHGSTTVNFICAILTRCPLAALQLQAGSKFIQALNSGTETPGAPNVKYTAIASLFDEIGQPALPRSTAFLDGATNIMIQDICPYRPVEHLTFEVDAVSYQIAKTALENDGQSDLSRIPKSVCEKGLIEWIDLSKIITPDEAGEVLKLIFGIPEILQNMTTVEPEIRPYAL